MRALVQRSQVLELLASGFSYIYGKGFAFRLRVKTHPYVMRTTSHVSEGISTRIATVVSLTVG